MTDSFVSQPMLSVTATLAILSAWWLVLRHWYPERSRRGFVWAIVIFAHAAHAHYLWWRFTVTLPAWSTAPTTLFAYGFLSVELLVTYLYLEEIRAYLGQQKTHWEPEVERNLNWYADQPPRVDVLIPTYNEPWHLLEKTILGAQSQGYANFATWLLDDGARDWLRQKAEACGVGYVSRCNGADHKAGNLNHAMQWLRRRGIELNLVAVLDADFIARPDFLTRTVALISDERVGIVQTPQWYYNPDPFQRRFGGIGAWPDEVRNWYDETQPRWDSVGESLCGGTTFVARVKAIDAIGGFSTETVSEDTLTSIKLRRQGFATRYLNERLSVGLAPEGLAEFLSQRARWRAGWIQIKTLTRRRGLRGTLAHWLFLWRPLFSAAFRMSWFGVALLYAFAGHWVLIAPADDTLAHLVPVWGERLLLAGLLGGRLMPFVSDVHALVQDLMLVRVSIRRVLFKGDVPFNVTRKAVQHEGVSVLWNTLAWAAPLGIALVAGCGVSIVRNLERGGDLGLLALNLGLSTWLCCQLTAIIIVSIERVQRRKEGRIEIHEPVSIVTGSRKYPGLGVNLSLDGVLVQCDSAELLPSEAQIKIRGVPLISSHLVYRSRKSQVAYRFDDARGRRELLRKLYQSDDYLHFPERFTLFGVLRGFVLGVTETLSQQRTRPRVTSKAPRGGTKPAAQ